jgi:hypothetical protein
MYNESTSNDEGTNMKSRTYKQVRTAVRCVFWGTMGYLAVQGLIALQNIVTALENKPADCNIVLNRDFTWDSASGDVINIYSCSAPNNVTLLKDGTWEWTE